MLLRSLSLGGLTSSTSSTEELSGTAGPLVFTLGPESAERCEEIRDL